jgi:dUTP pyrophosphatase
VHKGDRIAQLVIIALTRSEFSLVDELPAAARGEGGFGSTGR